MTLEEEYLRRRLIQEQKIDFDGPIPARVWPERYAAFFERVGVIGSKKWENYGNDPSERQRLPSADQVKQRARKLVTLAYRCRKEGTNEEKWRMDLEPVVLAQFDAEVAW